MHTCHAGLHPKAKSALWNFHSTKTAPAKSGKRVHKSYATNAADKWSLYYPADSAAGPAASGSAAAAAAAAARKGKAKLTDSRGELQHGASLHVGTSAQQQEGPDGQIMPLSHSRLRSKVYSILQSLL